MGDDRRKIDGGNFRALRNEGGSVIGHAIPEEISRLAAANARVIVASDGLIENRQGHPRGAGSFARVLGIYVREQKALSLMDALRKMSLLPAQRLEKAVPAMRAKGRLKVGADADITIFDPATVIDRATFEQPAQFSEGIKANYERDNVGAKREFDRALELDPNDSSIYFDYRQLLANIGESERAIALAQKAKLIDPQDSYVSYTLAQAFILAGRSDEGLRETGTTISLDDKNWWGYYWRGVAYSEKGLHDDAIAALQTAAGIDDSPLIRGVLACALARAGRRTDAQHVIDELILASKSKFVSQSSIAMGYGGLDEKDKAFEWLDKSLESHDEAILWIYKHPMFTSLRDDPRYKALVIKLNLAK